MKQRILPIINEMKIDTKNSGNFIKTSILHIKRKTYYDVDMLSAFLEKTNMSMLDQGISRRNQKTGKLSIKLVCIKSTWLPQTFV